MNASAAKMKQIFEDVKNGKMSIEEAMAQPVRMASSREYGTKWSDKTGKLLLYGARTQGRPLELSKEEYNLFMVEKREDIAKFVTDAGDKAFAVPAPEATPAEATPSTEPVAA